MVFGNLWLLYIILITIRLHQLTACGLLLGIKEVSNFLNLFFFFFFQVFILFCHSSVLAFSVDSLPVFGDNVKKKRKKKKKTGRVKVQLFFSLST